MPCRRHRASFDKVSEFDRRTPALTGGQRWIQEETMDQRGRSHLPRFTTARDDRRILRLTGMDRAATSRTIELQIQSVGFLKL
ncbi:hypothetical protein TNCV_1775271 [Trichonephila clavipes]|nr:hypothetical protein TNCV_1775271 [Trichonephila clavipes]